MNRSSEHPGEDPATGHAAAPRPPHEGLGFADLMASMSPQAQPVDHRSDRLDSVIVLVLTVVIVLVALTGLGNGSSALEKGSPAPLIRAEEASSRPASS